MVIRIIPIPELRTSDHKSNIGDAEQLNGKQKQQRRGPQISTLLFRIVLALTAAQNRQLIVVFLFIYLF